MIKKSSNKYVRFTITVLTLTTVLIGVSIFYIINTTFAVEKASNYEKAFKWQVENKGVVGLTVNISNIYKQKMLEWRLAKNDVDTLILGSSTVMGIKEDMFENHVVFNGATNSNPLYYTIPVAKYHSVNTESIKNIIISFDWALGLPYWPYKVIRHTPVIEQKSDVSILEKIKDAVSYQRVKIIFTNLADHFLADSISQYKCPSENTIGTDQFFHTDQPKSCHGFRFDGSAVFPGEHLTEKQWKNALAHGLTKYQKNFDTKLGTIDVRYLNDLKEIDRTLKQKGGQLIILIPPLIPNATTTMEVVAKELYIQKIHTLLEFTKENHITLLNTSKSEEYDCRYSDFLDPHHAFPSCYIKIFETVSF